MTTPVGIAFAVEVRVLGKWIRPLPNTYSHHDAVIMKHWYEKHFDRAEKARIVPTVRHN